LRGWPKAALRHGAAQRRPCRRRSMLRLCSLQRGRSMGRVASIGEGHGDDGGQVIIFVGVVPHMLATWYWRDPQRGGHSHPGRRGRALHHPYDTAAPIHGGALDHHGERGEAGTGPSPEKRASSRAWYVIERALFCAQQGGVGAAAPWRAGGRASRSSAARGRDREPAPPAQAPAVFVPRSAGETCLQGESTRCFSLSADLRPNAPSTPSAFFVLAGREWLYWCSRVDGPHPHPRHVQYEPPLYETPPPGCRHGSRGNAGTARWLMPMAYGMHTTAGVALARMLWVVQMIRGCDLRVGMSATSAREPQSDRVRLETPRARHLTS
jgi:hypothetical protein